MYIYVYIYIYISGPGSSSGALWLGGAARGARGGRMVFWREDPVDRYVHVPPAAIGTDFRRWSHFATQDEGRRPYMNREFN